LVGTLFKFSIGFIGTVTYYFLQDVGVAGFTDIQFVSVIEGNEFPFQTAGWDRTFGGFGSDFAGFGIIDTVGGDA
jgi:hypothetical protein